MARTTEESTAPLPGLALRSPAIAKWQFVEERARAVLDAFCHREVRPLGLTGTVDLLSLLAAVRAADTASVPTIGGALVRWYCLGPTLAGLAGDASLPRRQLAAVTFGAADAALDAEMCSLAVTLLREAGIPDSRLRVQFAVPSEGAAAARFAEIADLLRGLGVRWDHTNVTTAEPANAGLAFSIHLESGVASSASVTSTVLAEGTCGTTSARADRGASGVIGTAGTVDTVGFVVHLHRVIAALEDADGGYEPAVSVLVSAEGAGHAVGLALSIAQGLRLAGIRTDLVHGPRSLPDLHADAAARGARLLVAVGPSASADASDAALTLINLVTGATEAADLDDLQRKVAQLLD